MSDRVSANTAYLTGYIVEETLSLDNIFVIAMILLFFGVPRAYQHRVLFWGIICAIVLRGVMIGFGAALVTKFSWTLYLFSAFLIMTGVKVLAFPGKEQSLSHNPVIRFMRTHFNVTDQIHGHNFLVRLPDPKTGKRAIFATPLLMALVMVEISDVIFAVDSVPAIFAITSDPFIVYTSNIFAIIGLRALYFTVSTAIHRFLYLKPTLAAVLIFIGSKIFISDLTGEEIPLWLSLTVTVGIIATGGVLSLWRSGARVPAPVRRMAAGALALVIAAGGVAGGWWTLQQETVHYVTERAGYGPVMRIVSVTGTVEAASATITQIRASVPGRIDALYCRKDAKVNAGQICATIDRRRYEAVVQRQKALLAAAQARLRKDEIRLDRAKAALERNEASIKRRAVSSSSLKKARAEYEKARARVRRSEAYVAQRRETLSAAEVNLAATEIRSPIDGTVVSRAAELGQVVAADSALFAAVPYFALVKAEANLSAKDTGEINPGDKASLSFHALPDRLFDGEVSQTPQQLPPEDGAGHAIVISVPNPDRVLTPGMRALVRITAERRELVMRVSNEALRYSKDQLGAGERGEEAPPPGWARLWILRNGEPAAVTVKLGIEGGGYTEVVKGELRPGDELILGERTG